MSRIIKSHFADTHVQEKKIIHIKKLANEMNESLIDEESETPSVKQAIMEANQQAEAILIEAQKQADQIHMKIREEVEQWNAEKEVYIEEARQEGYLIGKEQGISESQNEYRHMLDRANEIIEQAKKEYQSVVEKSELTILNLGVKVAGKIMNQHLDENKEDYIYIVKNARKNAKIDANAKVKMQIKKV